MEILANKCSKCGKTVSQGDWYMYESHRKHCSPKAVPKKLRLVETMEARMAGFIVPLDNEQETVLLDQPTIDKLLNSFNIVIQEIDSLIGTPQVETLLERF